MYRFFTCLNAVICVVVILLLVLVFGYHMSDSNFRSVNSDYSSGWKYTDGTLADLMHPDHTEGEHTFERYITSDEADTASLCFMTRNLFFTVSLGDRVIYDFHPGLTGIMGKYYGDYVHFVNLPYFTGTEKLSITYISLLDANGTVFQDMRLQNSRDYEQSVIAKNYYKFFISSIIVVFGLILVIFGFFVDTDEQHKTVTTSLGAFSVILGLWTNSGTLIIQLISNDSVYTRLLDYTSLMLMPIPVLIFAAVHFGMLESVLFRTGVITAIANFIFTFGVSMSGFVDYHDILFLTHLVIIMSMVILSVMFLQYRKKLKSSSEQTEIPFALIFAFTIQISSGLVDMIRYYFGRSMDTAQFSRVGLMLFVMILSMYELKQLFYINRREAELRVMEKLAHTDGLTKLGNRNAFERFEGSLKDQTEGECIFVQFDINDLKLVNDKYGHAEGDRHIEAAAGIIAKAFPDGKCFRTGGDEFVAVVTDENCEMLTKIGIAKLQEMQNAYNIEKNPRVPLAIAYGWAYYEYADGDPEAAEREADMKMYECKLRMKNGKSYR